MSKRISEEVQLLIDSATINGETNQLVSGLNALDADGDEQLTYNEIAVGGGRLFSKHETLDPQSEAYRQFEDLHRYSIGLYAKQHVITEELRENYQKTGPLERAAAGLLVSAGVTNDAIKEVNRSLGQLEGLNVRLDKNYAKDAFEAIRRNDGQRR